MDNSRFVCIGYYALVDINKVNPQIGEFEERIEWRDIKDIPKMTYDHNEIVSYALEALRLNLDQKILGFNLLPQTFNHERGSGTIRSCYDKPFARNNFQKKSLI